MNTAPSAYPINVIAEIGEAIRAVFASAAELRPHSVVLTGSLARDEGSWISQSRRLQLLGDAEFLVVGAKRTSEISSARLTALEREVESRLRAIGMDIKITLDSVSRAYLTHIRPHIFAYELITHGKVLWGDPGILNLVPRFAISDIPLDDGFRLLANRVIELLEALCQASQPEALANDARYRAIKLCLDMATSFLLFQGEYEPTYRARAEKMDRLASVRAHAPVTIDRFANLVRVASRYKLGESERAPINTKSELAALIEDVRALWNWELERLTGRAGASGDELIESWLRQQRGGERLRGWASLVKRCGIAASIKSPRWLGEALRGSPRRLVYAAAAELFFSLPAFLGAREEADWAADERMCHSTLPVMNAAATFRSWRQHGEAIAWHYHNFLEHTRS